MKDEKIEALVEGFRFGFELRKFCEDRMKIRGVSEDEIFYEMYLAIKEIANRESTMADSDTQTRMELKDNPKWGEFVEDFIDGRRELRKKEVDVAAILADVFKMQ